MQSWKKVWREGIAPLLSKNQLQVLLKGLEEDDKHIVQGVTVQPPNLLNTCDWSVESCCPISYCGWKGDNLETVAEVEEFFARLCYEIDHKIGEPAGCRWFLNWVDETPRDQMRAELIAEIKLELERDDRK